jgi:hypothetical protein
VFASKLGADCSLLASPVNTKLIICPLVLLLLDVLADDDADDAADDDGRRSIHGTATCLPLLLDNPDVLELLPGVVLPGVVLLDVPALVLPPPALLLPPGRALLPGVGLGVPPDDEEPPEEPLGVVPPPMPLMLKDKIAKSIRPDAGLIIESLIVPIVSPEEPVTLAPISWLARNSW